MRLGKALCGVLVGALLASAVACGSEDPEEETGTCDSVCGCVVANGGDNTQCRDICSQTVQAGGNVKANCETLLDANGYPECKPKCDGFPTG
jgi:hypothetical protein